MIKLKKVQLIFFTQQNTEHCTVITSCSPIRSWCRAEIKRILWTCKSLHPSPTYKMWPWLVQLRKRSLKAETITHPSTWENWSDAAQVATIKFNMGTKEPGRFNTFPARFKQKCSEVRAVSNKQITLKVYKNYVSTFTNWRHTFKWYVRSS